MGSTPRERTAGAGFPLRRRRRLRFGIPSETGVQVGTSGEAIAGSRGSQTTPPHKVVDTAQRGPQGSGPMIEIATIHTVEHALQCIVSFVVDVVLDVMADAVGRCGRRRADGQRLADCHRLRDHSESQLCGASGRTHLIPEQIEFITELPEEYIPVMLVPNQPSGFCVGGGWRGAASMAGGSLGAGFPCVGHGVSLCGGDRRPRLGAEPTVYETSVRFIMVDHCDSETRPVSRPATSYHSGSQASRAS